MDGGDGIGAGQAEDVVVALLRCGLGDAGGVEGVLLQVEALEHGTHGAVEDEDAGGNEGMERMYGHGGGFSVRHPGVYTPLGGGASVRRWEQQFSAWGRRMSPPCGDADVRDPGVAERLLSGEVGHGQLDPVDGGGVAVAGQGDAGGVPDRPGFRVPGLVLFLRADAPDVAGLQEVELTVQAAQWMQSEAWNCVPSSAIRRIPLPLAPVHVGHEIMPRTVPLAPVARATGTRTRCGSLRLPGSARVSRDRSN